MRKGEFRIRRMKVREHGTEYFTFQLTGYEGGRRLRLRFKDRAQASAEKLRREIKAANGATVEVRPVNTRLSPEQVAIAEVCYRRLAGVDLAAAVEWYLVNYRPPVVATLLSVATPAYVASRKGRVEAVHLDDVERKLVLLQDWFPKTCVHDVAPERLQEKMTVRGWGPKTWNNVRGVFHAFFDFCGREPRRWCGANPCAAIEPRKVARGLPHIESAQKLRELFTYLETFTGGMRRPHKPGFLVPYFAFATFAGMRPSIPDGEIWKLGNAPDRARLVNHATGVIHVTPEIAKTDHIRQIKIRPNLAAWLQRYPLDEYPLVMRNMQALVTEVRKRFGLSDDVLRHTWISAHVAKFKSLGEAALEAGNSETIIRKHYLNVMAEAEAEGFWSILPSKPAAQSPRVI